VRVAAHGPAQPWTPASGQAPPLGCTPEPKRVCRQAACESDVRMCACMCKLRVRVPVHACVCKCACVHACAYVFVCERASLRVCMHQWQGTADKSWVRSNTSHLQKLLSGMWGIWSGSIAHSCRTVKPRWHDCHLAAVHHGP